jgi:hypothetical protein
VDKRIGFFQKGIAQLPVILVLVLMAIAIPATLKLTQTTTENRSSAASSAPGCSYGYHEIALYGECCDCEKAKEVRKCEDNYGNVEYKAGACDHVATNCQTGCETACSATTRDYNECCGCKMVKRVREHQETDCSKWWETLEACHTSVTECQDYNCVVVPTETPRPTSPPVVSSPTPTLKPPRCMPGGPGVSCSVYGMDPATGCIACAGVCCKDKPAPTGFPDCTYYGAPCCELYGDYFCKSGYECDLDTRRCTTSLTACARNGGECLTRECGEVGKERLTAYDYSCPSTSKYCCGVNFTPTPTKTSIPSKIPVSVTGIPPVRPSPIVPGPVCGDGDFSNNDLDKTGAHNPACCCPGEGSNGYEICNIPNGYCQSGVSWNYDPGGRSRQKCAYDGSQGGNICAYQPVGPEDLNPDGSVKPAECTSNVQCGGDPLPTPTTGPFPTKFWPTGLPYPSVSPVLSPPPGLGEACSEPKGILARVQKDEKDPLKEEISLNVGESIRLICVSGEEVRPAKNVEMLISGSNGYEVNYPGAINAAWSPQEGGNYEFVCRSTDPNCKALVLSNKAKMKVGETLCYRCQNEGQAGVIGVGGGDFDCNNTITMDDVGLWIVEYNDTLEVGAKQGRRADVDCDGKATIDDLAVWIRAYGGGE